MLYLVNSVSRGTFEFFNPIIRKGFFFSFSKAFFFDQEELIFDFLLFLTKKVKKKVKIIKNNKSKITSPKLIKKIVCLDSKHETETVKFFKKLFQTLE